MIRIIAIALIGLVALAAADVRMAGAETWPTKPIRWVIPYPPGGGTDLVSRFITAKLADVLHQPVVIENRPGGNTIIGTNAIAQAAPDGYTVGLITDAHSINQAAGRALPYDSERDFVAILQLIDVPFMLIANSEIVPERTLPELVAHAKQDPGWLTFGSLGPGSPHEMSMQWLKTMAGIDVLIVPYRGIGPAFQDVIAGHMKSMMIGVSVADEMIKAGKVHAIAVTPTYRLKSVPEVPTIAEQGYPDYDFLTWYAMMAPAGTPKYIVERLNHEINAILVDPEVRAKIEIAGSEVAGGTSEHLTAIIERDVRKYQKIFAITGIKLD
jgi:tripartite-type tricarboxylate transporter receptor subunit TctC